MLADEEQAMGDHRVGPVRFAAFRPVIGLERTDQVELLGRSFNERHVPALGPENKFPIGRRHPGHACAYLPGCPHHLAGQKLDAQRIAGVPALARIGVVAHKHRLPQRFSATLAGR